MFGRKTSPAEAEYKAAKQALLDNQRAEKAAGIREETEEFRRLNAAVVAAEKRVSWLRR